MRFLSRATARATVGLVRDADECAHTAVVDRYNDALGRGDLASARRYLADVQFRFVAPIGEYNDADAFVNGVWGVVGILEDVQLRRRFVDADEVLDILEFHTRFDELIRTSVVQWCRVADGRIAEMELFFDAHDYKSMFERRR